MIVMTVRQENIQICHADAECVQRILQLLEAVYGFETGIDHETSLSRPSRYDENFDFGDTVFAVAAQLHLINSRQDFSHRLASFHLF